MWSSRQVALESGSIILRQRLIAQLNVNITNGRLLHTRCDANQLVKSGQAVLPSLHLSSPNGFTRRIHSDAHSEKKVGSISKKTGGSKAEFKSTPVDPSIAQYIESLGMGIPKRKKRKLYRKRNQGGQSNEKEFFQRQAELRRRNQTLSSRSDKESETKGASILPPPPFASIQNKNSDEDTIAGYRVRRLPVKVLGSASSMDDPFPKSSKGLPEVALAGRSNVGKSTLLNALLYGSQHSPKGGLPRGIKAKMSERPGETRSITLYQLSSDLIAQDQKHKVSMLLADLPGYGFAYASPQAAEQWQELMQHYLVTRGQSLKRILLLIDARHGFKRADLDFLEELESIMYSTKTKKKSLPPIQIVLTKCDLVTREDLARRVTLVKQQLSNALRRETSMLPVMLVSARDAGFTSSRSNKSGGSGGILELQRELAALAPLPKTKRNKNKTNKKN